MPVRCGGGGSILFPIACGKTDSTILQERFKSSTTNFRKRSLWIKGLKFWRWTTFVCRSRGKFIDSGKQKLSCNFRLISQLLWDDTYFCESFVKVKLSWLRKLVDDLHQSTCWNFRNLFSTTFGNFDFLILFYIRTHFHNQTKSSVNKAQVCLKVFYLECVAIVSIGIQPIMGFPSGWADASTSILFSISLEKYVLKVILHERV